MQKRIAEVNELIPLLPVENIISISIPYHDRTQIHLSGDIRPLAKQLDKIVGYTALSNSLKYRHVYHIYVNGIKIFVMEDKPYESTSL